MTLCNRLILVAALIATPIPAFASCEQLLTVHSRSLAFTYVGTAEGDDEVLSAEHWHEKYRSMAHALETAQWAFGYARSHHVRGPAARVVLLAHGALAAEDLGDSVAVALAKEGARVVRDSVCVLWTIEIGRFRTPEDAIQFARDHEVAQEDSANYVPAGDAVVYFESCEGTWRPGTFVLGRLGDPWWIVRRGLYLTRADAARAAKEPGLHAKVVQQRVDGELLEQALARPAMDY